MLEEEKSVVKKIPAGFKRNDYKDYQEMQPVECTNYARKGGVCRTHGTKDVKKICSFEGCTNLVGKEGVCITHGATKERKRCNFEICTKQAIKGGVCVTHGAKRKRCSHEGVYERCH